MQQKEDKNWKFLNNFNEKMRDSSILIFLLC